jgi:hypothetical protein
VKEAYQFTAVTEGFVQAIPLFKRFLKERLLFKYLLGSLVIAPEVLLLSFFSKLGYPLFL